MAAAFPEVFRDAEAIAPGAAVKDAGGSITTPATPTKTPCKAQGDVATREMRADADFVQGDIRIMVINIGALDTTMRVRIASGPHAGLWALRSVTRDSAGVGWECRGRRCP